MNPHIGQLILSGDELKQVAGHLFDAHRAEILRLNPGVMASDYPTWSEICELDAREDVSRWLRVAATALDRAWDRFKEHLRAGSTGQIPYANRGEGRLAIAQRGYPDKAYSVAAELFEEFAQGIGAFPFQSDRKPAWEEFIADTSNQTKVSAWLQMGAFIERMLLEEHSRSITQFLESNECAMCPRGSGTHPIFNSSLGPICCGCAQKILNVGSGNGGTPAVSSASASDCVLAVQNGIPGHTTNSGILYGNGGQPTCPYNEALLLALEELQRATKKFPTWPTDPVHALAVLSEEVGELTKEVVELTYEPHRATPGGFRKEAIQTAAMALRFLMSLESYKFTPGPQHSQGQPQA